MSKHGHSSSWKLCGDSQAEAEQEFREAQADKTFANEVLRRSVDWRHWGSEGKLTSHEVNLVLGYVGEEDPTAKQDYLEEQGELLAGVFVKVLNSIAHLEVVEYTIILIDQLFGQDRSPEDTQKAIEYFLEYQAKQSKLDIFKPFMNILSTSGQHHPYIFLRVQHILSLLLSAAYARVSSKPRPVGEVGDAVEQEEKQLRTHIVHFLRVLISKITTLSSSSGVSATRTSTSTFTSYNYPNTPSASVASDNRELMASMSALKNLLRASPKIQELFADMEGLHALTRLLHKETHNAQLLYLVGFNIWLLSFHDSVANKLREVGAIKKICAVVKVNVMEKVIRINFAILKNFLDHPGTSFAEDMIGHGLVSIVDTLLKRKYKDPDITNDMVRVQSVLQEAVRSMSTFEKYSVEVWSGALSWSNPAHKNEVFWRENIMQFEAKNFALVQQLIKVAEGVAGASGSPSPPPASPSGSSYSSSTSPSHADREETAREIACHDLGEFARVHPEGKKIVIRLGGKDVLMKCLQDKSSKVSKAALLATQKLMVANWEFLQKNSSGGVAALVSQKRN